MGVMIWDDPWMSWNDPEVEVEFARTAGDDVKFVGSDLCDMNHLLEIRFSIPAAGVECVAKSKLYRTWHRMGAPERLSAIRECATIAREWAYRRLWSATVSRVSAWAS